MTDVVGYFHWRAGQRGEVTCEKQLKLHVDVILASPMNTTKDMFREGLLAQYPLDELQWKLPLAELERIYPIPGGGRTNV